MSSSTSTDSTVLSGQIIQLFVVMGFSFEHVDEDTRPRAPCVGPFHRGLSCAHQDRPRAQRASEKFRYERTYCSKKSERIATVRRNCHTCRRMTTRRRKVMWITRPSDE